MVQRGLNRVPVSTDQTMKQSGEKFLTRITLPHRMMRRMERLRNIQSIEHWKQSSGNHSRSGKNAPIVISCKRSQFNHRTGQTYTDFGPQHLASKGWKHKEAKGDYFTINATQNNPAFDDDDKRRALPGDKPYRSSISTSPGVMGEDDPPEHGRQVPDIDMSNNFKSFNLYQQLVDALTHCNIHRPTTIQLKTIPAMLAGKNVLCTAETGSGKTLAYLLPMIDKLHRYKSLYKEQEEEGSKGATNRPHGIILVPSRELAEQIYSVSCDLARFTPFHVDVKCGGNQTQRLLRDPPVSLVDILISTPGVLSKLLTNKLYDLSRLSMIVIDEADTMLDDSFNELTLRIIQKLKVTGESLFLPPLRTASHAGDMASRGSKTLSYNGDVKDVATDDDIGATQIAFVGATLPRDLVGILGDIVPMESIETITTSSVHRVMPHVSQKFLRIGPTEKPVQLLSHLKSTISRRIPTLIFCNSSSTACFLGYFLDSNNICNTVLHSRMPHNVCILDVVNVGILHFKHTLQVREGRYEKFRNGETDILICTDIASRGLDTVRARHVINYEFPNFMSDYVHRVGRVGRVGSKGSCFTLSFISYKWDVELLWKIETSIRRKTELHNVNANIKRKLLHRFDAEKSSEKIERSDFVTP